MAHCTALALAARWLTCLAQHPLFLKNSSSELPLFLKWVTTGSNPTPSTPWCWVLPYDHITSAPWRLWTLTVHFVSLCHCEFRKESSPSRFTTSNFLYCFQISGPVDSTAFFVISLADSDILRPLAHSYPLTLLKTSKYPVCFMQKHVIPPKSSIKQNSVFFSSCLLSQEFRLVTQLSGTELLPSSLSLEYSHLT